MALPENPISGDYRCTNPGLDDHWICPNCYATHTGSLEDETVDCACGARLELTIEQQPVCVATCIDPEEDQVDD